jgi:hypothetical protein
MRSTIVPTIIPNSINITNAGVFSRLLTDMTSCGDQGKVFITCWARLINLISSYLDNNKTRRAEIWFADKQDTGHSWITWVIYDPAIQHPERPGVVLAGAMHFHESTQTWGIHT